MDVNFLKGAYSTMKVIAMQIVSYCALACAELGANFVCYFFFHQEQEPEAVRKLRKF